jgi:hypothetical protein
MPFLYYLIFLSAMQKTTFLIGLLLCINGLAQLLNTSVYTSISLQNNLQEINQNIINYSNNGFVNNCNRNSKLLYNNTYFYPMNYAEFAKAKQTISSQHFDDSRLCISKQVVASNRLLCSQIAELMKTLNFECSRLELAKYALNHAFDKQNIYLLYSAFKLKSSVQELQQSIYQQQTN